jgi:hypothetical protein
MTKPKTYTTDLANLPQALAPLTQQPRWVTWKWEQRRNDKGEVKWTKPPRQPNGALAHNDKPETWSPYSTVLAKMNGADGIGYQLLNDLIAAIDLDGCRDEPTGAIDPWAKALVDQAHACGAYVEISPSGTGLRIIGLSDKAAHQSKHPVPSNRDKAGVEVYRNVNTARYICVTGAQIGASTKLTNIDAVIDRVISEYGQQEPKPNSDTNPNSSNGTDRSADFNAIVWSMAAAGKGPSEIEQHLRQGPGGPASKYLHPKDRLRVEVWRCYKKWQETNRKAAEATELDSERAAECEMQGLEWLWQWRLAKGALNILAGLPDQGKGLLWSDIAARLTTAEMWPANEGVALLGNIIIFTAEDDISRTVVPRLVAAGADLNRIEIVKMARKQDGSKRMFNLVTDLPLLEAKIKEVGDVILVIIDPISAYLGVGKINNSSSTDVRGVLGPLSKLAEDTQAAILAVMHFNKKVDITNAVLRIQDSIAYVAQARSICIAVEDSENKEARLFLKAKGNLAPRDLPGLRYRIGVQTVGFDKRLDKDIDAPFVVWDDNPVNITALEAMEGTHGNAREEAQEFLLTRLADGPVPADDLMAEGRANCISKRTLERAKRDLGIISDKEQGKLKGGWCWKLPPQPVKRKGKDD